MKRPWRFIRHWGTLGNLVEGDCTVAAYYHLVMALNVLNGSTFKRILYRLGSRVPHSPFAIKEYTVYLATLNEKPSPRTGVDPVAWLEWQKTQGNVLDYYMFVPPVNEAALRNALDTFGGVLLAGALTSISYNQMPNPWILHLGDTPNLHLSHAVAYLDYTPVVDRVVTWGRWQGMTTAYRELCFNYVCVFVHRSDPHAPSRLIALRKLKGTT